MYEMKSHRSETVAFVFLYEVDPLLLYYQYNKKTTTQNKLRGHFGLVEISGIEPLTS